MGHWGEREGYGGDGRGTGVTGGVDGYGGVNLVLIELIEVL